MRLLKTKDISRMLDEDPGTLRQWFLAIEKAGYSFRKVGRGHRRLTQEEGRMMKEFKRIKEEDGYTIDEAASAVVHRWGHGVERQVGNEVEALFERVNSLIYEVQSVMAEIQRHHGKPRWQ